MIPSRCKYGFAPRPLALEISRMFGAPALGAALIVALVVPVHAEPKGGSVVAGQASIVRSGVTTTINQSSQRAAIDWQSFNVGAAEAVNFLQPGATSTTLNRIVGNDASTIFGRISANGNVLLVNPNGILFGRTAHVDVGGLVATTANIGNAEFMAGRLEFTQQGKPGATVENRGTITIAQGGIAALVGRGVANSGVISARLGKVSLAAGDAFVLDLYGDKLVNLIVDAAAMSAVTDAFGRPLAARVDQSGNINADGGVVQLTAATASRLVDSLINVSGTVRATAFELQPGRISLLGDSSTRVALDGTLDASGQVGGQVKIVAGDIDLGATARISARGDAGGGQIAVGGGWQGRGDLPHAHAVTVAAGATLDASANGTGPGGTVVVWSDGQTRFGGSIAASGGASGGDGGRVEVSGRQGLGFDGSVDAASRGGRAGMLLLDPDNLTISAGGAQTLPGPGGTGDLQVAAAAVNRVLTTGTSVELTANRNITVDAALDGRLPQHTVSGGGLSLVAGGDVAINRNVILADGAFSVAAGGTFTQAAGSLISSGSATLSIDAGGVLSAQQLLSTGAVTLRSTGGAVNVARPLIGSGGDTQRAASLTINGKTGVTLAGARVAGDVALTSSGGGVSLGDVLDTSGALIIRSAGAVQMQSITAASVAVGGLADGSAAASFTLTGTLASAGAVTARTSGALTLAGTSALDSRTLVLDAGTDLTSAATALKSAGAATLGAGNDLTLAGAAGFGGVATLTAGHDALLNGDLTSAGNLVVSAGRDITQAAASKVSSGDAALTLTAARTLSAQQLLSRGAVTLSAVDGALGVARPVIGAGDASARSASLTATGKTGVTLAGARVASDVALTSSGGGVSLAGAVDVGGALALRTDDAARVAHTTAGALTVAGASGAGAGSFSLVGNATVAGVSTVRTSGDITLAAAAGLSSTGALTLISSGGAIVTGTDTRIASAADVTLEAKTTITIGAGTVAIGATTTQALVQRAVAGVHAQGAGTVTLTADGDITADGSLRTEGGSLLVTSTGGDIALRQLTTATPAASGLARLSAPGGAVVLRESLGGPTTGYQNYADGYRSDLKPTLGALDVTARTIETNGLNLDGIATPGAGGNGLRLAAIDRVIVNNVIAVNKGEISISASAPAGVAMIGASIYSRGYDPAAHEAAKVAYNVDVTAPVIALWDRDDEVANLAFIRNASGGDASTPESYTVPKLIFGNNAANYADGGNLVVATNAAATHVGTTGAIRYLDVTPADRPMTATDAPVVRNAADVANGSFAGVALKLLTYRINGADSATSFGDNFDDTTSAGLASRAMVSGAGAAFAAVFTPVDDSNCNQCFLTRYNLAGRYVDTSGSAARLLLYPGIIAATDGTTQIDAQNNTFISGIDGTAGGGTQSNNSSRVDFAQVGGFGAIVYVGTLPTVAAPTVAAPAGATVTATQTVGGPGPVAGANQQAVGTAGGPGSTASANQGAAAAAGAPGTVTAAGLVASVVLPPPDALPDTPPVTAGGATPIVGDSLRLATGAAVFVTASGRAAAEADLGRSGAVAGSAVNVFLRRYPLARSSNPATCANDAIDKDPASGSVPPCAK